MKWKGESSIIWKPWSFNLAFYHSRSIRRSEAPEPGPNFDEIPSEDDNGQAVVPFVPASDPLTATISPNPDRNEEISPPIASDTQQVLLRSPSGQFTKPPNIPLPTSTTAPIKRTILPKGLRELANLAKTQFEDERSGQLAKFRHPRPSFQNSSSLREPASPKSANRQGINWATPEDLEALAVWHVEHPKGTLSQKLYYQRFEIQVSCFVYFKSHVFVYLWMYCAYYADFLALA
jgi:hypothetical protein